MPESATDVFWKLAKSFKACMMTTIDGADLRSRPMRPIIDVESGELWFLTRSSSHKTEEISNDARVNINFEGSDGESFLAVSGTARLSSDHNLIRTLWSPVAQNWLPEGPDSPHVALIRVRPLRAEVWDLRQNAVAQRWDLAPDIPESEHGGGPNRQSRP